MLRTVEVIIVILILAGAFIAASLFAVLPSPRQISSPDLRQLGLTTLQMLDTDKDLTETVFKDPADPSWTALPLCRHTGSGEQNHTRPEDAPKHVAADLHGCSPSVCPFHI